VPGRARASSSDEGSAAAGGGCIAEERPCSLAGESRGEEFNGGEGAGVSAPNCSPGKVCAVCSSPGATRLPRALNGSGFIRTAKGDAACGPRSLIALYFVLAHGRSTCGILPRRPLCECAAAASLLPGREQGGRCWAASLQRRCCAAGTRSRRPPPATYNRKSVYYNPAILSQKNQTTDEHGHSPAESPSSRSLGQRFLLPPQYYQMSVPKNANSGNCYFAVFQPLFGSVVRWQLKKLYQILEIQ
jgi:hypothetical protein